MIRPLRSKQLTSFQVRLLIGCSKDRDLGTPVGATNKILCKYYRTLYIPLEDNVYSLIELELDSPSTLPALTVMV